jgi:hypothetical protein
MNDSLRRWSLFFPPRNRPLPDLPESTEKNFSGIVTDGDIDNRTNSFSIFGSLNTVSDLVYHLIQ